jgi:hypothetical protein
LEIEMQSTLRDTIRATAFVLGIILSGAALAAPKDGSTTNDDKANCLSEAAVQYSLATAQCAAYPSYSGAYSSCMVNAVNAYTLAAVACETSEAAVAKSALSIGRPGKSLGSPSSGDSGKPARISPVRLKAFGN